MVIRIQLLFLVLAPTILFAQDIHLSQFYTAQLNLNPAVAAQYDGDFKVCGNHRNQWREMGEPLTTNLIGVTKKFFRYNDQIDAGILVAKDQFSAFGLNTMKVMFSGSYAKTINGHWISAGLQVGLVLKSTNLDNQTFPNQWVYDQGKFDSELSNQESSLRAEQKHPDVNIGIAWSKQLGMWKATAGIALNHIIRPKDTYFNQHKERRRVRKVIHSEFQHDLNSKWSVEPKLLYMWTTKAQDLILGSLVRRQLNINKFKSVFAGAVYRHGFFRNVDAAIPVVGFAYDDFELGFSYDFNTSDLSKGSQRKSSFELSLTYTAPLYSPKNLSIPCDRY